MALLTCPTTWCAQDWSMRGEVQRVLEERAKAVRERQREVQEQKKAIWGRANAEILAVSLPGPGRPGVVGSGVGRTLWCAPSPCPSLRYPAS